MTPVKVVLYALLIWSNYRLSRRVIDLSYEVGMLKLAVASNPRTPSSPPSASRSSTVRAAASGAERP
jgi:hypothetical protein